MSTTQGLLTKTYNFGLVQVVIGAVPVSGGWSDDGGIEFEQGADLWEKTVGATGLTTYSLLNDDSVEATLTVMETSNAYTALAALMTAQIAAASLGGFVPPLPFLMFDPSTGDTIAAANTIFMARPNQSKGRVAQAREFRISLAGAGATAAFGVLTGL